MSDDKKKKTVKTVRLPKPQGDRIEELAEEQQMTEADMYRRLIRTGLSVETNDSLLHNRRESEEEEADEPDIVADGGAVIRPLLRNMTAATCVIGLLAIAGSFMAAEAGAGAIGIEFLSMALAAFLTTVGTFLPLLTNVPERVDRRLWAASRRVRRRVAA